MKFMKMDFLNETKFADTKEKYLFFNRIENVIWT